MSPKSSASYLLVFGSSVLLLVCIIVSFVSYIDPFNYFSIQRSDTNALSRIDQLPYLRFSKPQQLRQIKPDALIIGSSRAAAIPTADAAWYGYKPYNLAMPGVSLYEMRRLLQHAQAIHRVRELIIALDFELFVPPVSEVLENSAEASLLRRGADSWRWSYRANRLQALQQAGYSSTALSHALTIRRAGRRESDTDIAGARQFEADGGWAAPGSAMQELRSLHFSINAVLAKHGRAQPDTELQWRQYKALLGFCFEQKIAVRIVLTPVHVFYLQRQFALGYRHLWRQWHAQLLLETRAMAARYNTKVPEVLAFNHARGLVNEPLNLGKTATDTAFRDGSHFRQTFGARIISAALGSSADERDNFGYVLQVDSVAAYVSEVESLVDAFNAEAPQ